MEDIPPGFRFYPTEEELVAFYLHNKLEGRRNDMDRVIPVIDLYSVEPCHLPSTVNIVSYALFIYLFSEAS